MIEMDIWFTKIRVRMGRRDLSGNKEAGQPPLWSAGHDLSPNVVSLGEKPHGTSRSLVQASPITLGELEDSMEFSLGLNV
jgi:hypothetical protein